MKTKQRAAGVSTVPLNMEQVTAESEILAKILNETLLERLMEEAMLCEQTPFQTLNKFVVEAIISRAATKVQAAYAPKPPKLDTPAKLRNRIYLWNVTEMIQ